MRAMHEDLSVGEVREGGPDFVHRLVHLRCLGGLPAPLTLDLVMRVMRVMRVTRAMRVIRVMGITTGPDRGT